MKPPRKLVRKCVAAEKALWVGCGSGEQEGESSAHRGPDVRKRTPVEDAAGAGRQTGLPKVESLVASSLWLVSLCAPRFSITSEFDD